MASGSVELPPQRGLEESWKLLAIILLQLAVGGITAGYVVFTSGSALDFIVRNQYLVWPAIGLLISATLLLVGVRRGYIRLSDSSFGLLSGTARPFLIGALWAGICGLFSGVAKPIPPETGIDVVTEYKTESGNRALLLFVHGWNGDSKGTWRQFPQLAAGDPNLAAYDVWAVDYPTFMVRRSLRIVQLAETLDRVLEKSKNAFKRYDRIVVISHSMGGLIAREIAVQRALGAKTRNFDKLIEIATPHQGANPAAIARALGVSKEFTDDMSSGSSFLVDLSTHWRGFSARPETFCFASPQDSIVSQVSATDQCIASTNYLRGGHTEIVKPTKRSDPYYAMPAAEVP